MKKKRLAAGALALTVSVTACGCGEQVYEMTKEEEAVIVHYAAHAVSKFNKKQPEGIEDVTVLKAMMEKEAKEKEKEQQQEEEQKNTAEDKNQSAAPASDAGGQQAEPQKKYVSLSRALQLNGVKAVFSSQETVASYQASQSYMIRANSGNDLLILHVNLKNDGNKTARCDILSKMPSFRLTVNGELSVSADTTILLNDLGTYQGSIKAGKKVKTVLVFQVQKGAVKPSDSMELEVTADGTSSLVQLTG